MNVHGLEKIQSDGAQMQALGITFMSTWRLREVGVGAISTDEC